jgi:hypothetical protein
MLRTKLKGLIGVLMVVGLMLLGLGVTATPAGEARRGNKREVKVKWEYKALTASQIEKLAPKRSMDLLTGGLNALGEQGWELVTILPGRPDLGAGLMGLGPPGGPGRPGMPGGLPKPKMNPDTYLFKRPK